MKSIVSLTHNDLDGFGCRLNITEKFGDIVEHHTTNYKNLPDRVQEISEFTHRNIIKLIIISDVCFETHRASLEILDDLGIPIIYLDHHLYSEGFQEGFKNIKFIIDTSKCATLLTADFLGIQNNNLKKINNYINAFDLWQTKDSNFMIGMYLNSYFWEHSLKSLPGYELPHNFKDFITSNVLESKEYIQNLKDRKLIYEISGTLVAFTDKFYQDIIFQTFSKRPEIKCIVILNSWGGVKVRFKDTYQPEFKEFIKENLIGNLSGHENAFAYTVKPGIENLIEEVQKICKLVR